jgi:hypothetical protein
MARPTDHPPTLLLLAAFSRHEAALDWARQRAEATWGEIALESRPMIFNQTDYYTATMGPELRKVFFLFREPYDPAQAADDKLTTNRWEAEFATAAPGGETSTAFSEPRPLNLDPGYITRGKLVLTSTKDFAHRVYLRDGIYAEVTLTYRHGRWEHHRFTFSDYRQPQYHAFFDACRDWLAGRRKEGVG